MWRIKSNSFALVVSCVLSNRTECNLTYISADCPALLAVIAQARSGNDVDRSIAPVAVATNPWHRKIQPPPLRFLVNLWYCVLCNISAITNRSKWKLGFTPRGAGRFLSWPITSACPGETLTMYLAEFNHVGERPPSFNSSHRRPIIHGLALLLPVLCRQILCRRKGTWEHSFRLVLGYYIVALWSILS